MLRNVLRNYIYLCIRVYNAFKKSIFFSSIFYHKTKEQWPQITSDPQTNPTLTLLILSKQTQNNKEIKINLLD